ncbi:hypothetical protein DFH08DRAFT_795762 [Mycena albidolilacea]|uniref:Uncharacterized protein n=1 Tax=Mycena albidolilacea TaxID=1033008 RepID=A0AAD7F423_9AGAR|nr:hypothetical protein DFH08DRAFT_795762 [Mycena albidolilacea]
MWDGGRQQGQKMSSPNSEEASEVLPEALEEYTGDLEKTIVPYSLRGKTMHCITKLAKIHLTADNPGGLVEILASTTTKRTFPSRGLRTVPQQTLPHTTSKMTNCAWVYCMGLNGESTTLDKGNKCGRVLTWPNLYQYRMAPFRLLDPTKPLVAKIFNKYIQKRVYYLFGKKYSDHIKKSSQIQISFGAEYFALPKKEIPTLHVTMLASFLPRLKHVLSLSATSPMPTKRGYSKAQNLGTFALKRKGDTVQQSDEDQPSKRS